MAEPARTVRVSGLPTDIEHNRLKDKLLIHFLRARNGGGEIDTVSIVPAASQSALITFEDSSVAQRVIQCTQHILEVDGKKYKLTATKHQESLDPDQVVLRLSATVDYSQLPGGVEAVKSLRKSHQEVQINYTASERCCTLSGSYSDVQAALTQLLGRPGGPEPAENNDTSRAAPSSSRSVQTSRKPQASEDQSRKPNKQKENDNTDMSSDEESSNSKRNLAPDGNGWDTHANAVSAVPQSPTMFTEEFSLIVDADMFQYLQKRCKKEYQRILNQYDVEVVNETSQGLTTLFLNVADAAVMDDAEERLKRAKKAISRLYQENEKQICRDQLPKVILNPRGGFQRAIDDLSVRFPKLLLNDDERYLYIIGNSKDVSEAKTALLLDIEEPKSKKEDVASLLKYPSYNLGSSSTHSDEEGAPLTPPFAVASLDEELDPTLRSEEDELRAEGAAKYKLAARFKDSRLGGLGSRPADFTFRTNSSPSRQARHGPMLGCDVLSETAGVSGEVVSRAQNTGGDILFKSTYMSSPSASTQMKTSDTIDAQFKNSPLSITPAGFSELPPFGSGATLKRASSFSGTPQQKAQVVNQKSRDDSCKSAVKTRARSSSFGSRAAKDKQEVHNAEISVFRVLWQYIKEAYSTRVEDLTTEVQMTENFSEGSRDLTVLLKGADSSKVRLCQERLQKLVASVNADFCVQELRLSELGVADPENETLQACCSEVRSRFKKVTVHIIKNSLYLVGPQHLCSQVAATLREVFSGEPDRHGLSSPSASMWNSATSLQLNVPQSLQLTDSQTGTTDNQQWKTTYGRDFGGNEVVNGSYSQSSMRKDHFAQAEVITSTEHTGTGMKEDGHKGERSVNYLLTENETSAVNSDLSADRERTLQTGPRHSEIMSTPDKSRSDQGGQAHSCVCGEDGMSPVKTKCGVTMCPKCLETRHVHCRVCTETEQIPPGIQGEMKKSRLQMSLPGHSKDSVIKITYRIPDGIQEEGHPSPGKPFKGGTFEAYLPNIEKAKKLLPRLEKAFRQGLTFIVTGKGPEARVTWGQIPHKTSLQGGKAQKGYPDSTYLTRLSDVLSSQGID
ncbi:uncharacterized protein si:busm1-163l24.3 [Kryptolebias marmoratus]|uniref:RING-type E3 ubiquitin transferase n=1 Tax=Kryptolebias marmoratus TaxID=37003 RepID=A0A3Q3BFX5_KRYMA|nr:uncharacterized protein si:busm1-163l24.3 [Kryptolebias marmoratus]XP_017284954.1 uncharacterized protein si:busm1-163l24.3 [Kryptolebias marmoratus]